MTDITKRVFARAYAADLMSVELVHNETGTAQTYHLPDSQKDSNKSLRYFALQGVANIALVEFNAGQSIAATFDAINRGVYAPSNGASVATGRSATDTERSIAALVCIANGLTTYAQAIAFSKPDSDGQAFSPFDRSLAKINALGTSKRTALNNLMAANPQAITLKTSWLKAKPAAVTLDL